jgi:hypothetical protein
MIKIGLIQFLAALYNSIDYYGWESLDNGYLENDFLNKYKKILKTKKKLWICSSIYILTVIQISCNFIIV